MRWSRPLVPLLTVVAIAAGTALFLLRPASRELRGDEATYVAMAASIARDFDLRFDERDRAWAEARRAQHPALILERTAKGISYSKPVLYPLLAAPFVALAGDWGPALFNLAAMLAASFLAWRALAPRGRVPDAERLAMRDLLLTFLATGLALVYLPWRMTESLQLALALAGLAVTFAALRRRDSRLASELFGAALLGLLVSLREPNALVAAAPVLAAMLLRDFRRAVRVAAAIATSYLAVVALTFVLTGAANPYKAPRSTFNAETGFPVGVEAEKALARFDFDSELATSTLGLVPAIDLRKSAYAALYFLIGRHTGLLIYVPAAWIFLVAAIRRRDRAGTAALLAFAALALFYLVWMPVNYFGGETFVGNRYILAGLPLLLVAPLRMPGRRSLLSVWLVAAIVAASALASLVRSAGRDATSQSHANAGLFRLLPYESTASHLDGRRDRYWANDFVRFVDPFARADAWSFELQAGGPGAELEIATRPGDWPGSPLHFLVHSDAAKTTLEVSDWGRKQRFELAPIGDGRSGSRVEFRTSPAWRRHGYWWDAEAIYEARLVRLRALGASGASGARGDTGAVRIRYLGRNPPPEGGFARDVLRVELQGEAVASGRSELTLELRNTGTWSWAAASALPVQVGLRFLPLDLPGEPAIEARRPLPHAVPPGETLSAKFAVDWPSRPGRYRVSVDLVLEDVAWFEDRVGSPIARTEIDLKPGN